MNAASHDADADADADVESHRIGSRRFIDDSSTFVANNGSPHGPSLMGSEGRSEIIL